MTVTLKDKIVDTTRYIQWNTEGIGWIRLLIWALGVQDHAKDLIQLFKKLNALANASGTTFLVAYLKEANRLTVLVVAGAPGRSDPKKGPIVQVSRPGLPSIIPFALRELISSHDAKVTRAVLTLLSVYRIIHIPAKLNLSTITDKFSGLTQTLPSYEVQELWDELFSNRVVPLKDIEFKLISKKGPNGLPSWIGSFRDAQAWIGPTYLREALNKIADLTPGGPGLIVGLDRIIELTKISTFFSKVNLGPSKVLGKLSRKYEAAGKVRVFAITDYWTQMVLYPLHVAIFELLKGIPQDGTFNQSKPLTLLNEFYRGTAKTFSFDLSSATDRLPVRLQRQILALWLGPEYARSWKTLLVNRDWYLDGKPYRYGVGQPMGAYSSWAMLALTHHFLVQLSARRAGVTRGWFHGYGVLGDDIVIANELVATQYLLLMKQLGVEINMGKSLVSPRGVFEFAKRIVSWHTEYTPLGPKNLLLALRNYQLIPLVFLDMLGKGIYLSLKEILSMIDGIPKGTFRKGLSPSKISLLKLVLTMPGGYFSNFPHLMKDSSVFNGASGLGYGPNSAFAQAWVDGITHVMKLLSFEYVGKIRSLKPRLGDVVVSSLKEILNVDPDTGSETEVAVSEVVYPQRPAVDDKPMAAVSLYPVEASSEWKLFGLTTSEAEDLSNSITYSPMGEVYKLTREKLLDGMRLLRLTTGYFPKDRRSLFYLKDNLKTNTSLNRLLKESLAEIQIRAYDAFIRTRDIDETIDLVPRELIEAGAFARLARRMKREVILRYHHRARVNRDQLPVLVHQDDSVLRSGTDGGSKPPTLESGSSNELGCR